jgi:hypothetical protein
MKLGIEVDGFNTFVACLLFLHFEIIADKSYKSLIRKYNRIGVGLNAY